MKTAFWKYNLLYNLKPHNANTDKGQARANTSVKRKAFPDSLSFLCSGCECQLAQSSLADNVSCQSFLGSDVWSLSAGNGLLEWWMK